MVCDHHTCDDLHKFTLTATREEYSAKIIYRPTNKMLTVILTVLIIWLRLVKGVKMSITINQEWTSVCNSTLFLDDITAFFVTRSLDFRCENWLHS